MPVTLFTFVPRYALVPPTFPHSILTVVIGALPQRRPPATYWDEVFPFACLLTFDVQDAVLLTTLPVLWTWTPPPVGRLVGGSLPRLAVVVLDYSVNSVAH